MADSRLLLPEDEIEYQLKRVNRLPLYEFRSFRHLTKCMFCAYFPEYASLPLFYWLGKEQMLKTSYALQALFLAGSSYLQMSGYKFLLTMPTVRLAAVNWDREQPLRLLEPLRTVMGIPVEFLRLRRWQFELIALAPNYLHVISTIQAIATVEHEWVSHAEPFRRHWQTVPVIGEYIGDAGLPQILKISVGLNLASHLAFVIFHRKQIDPTNRAFCQLAEASNLLFLEQAANTDGGLHIVRTLVAPVVKMPMIWMKVTLLGLLYGPGLDFMGMLSLLVAILLAFYGLMPVLPSWAKMMQLIFSFPWNDEKEDQLSIWSSCRKKNFPSMVGRSCMGSVLVTFGVLFLIVIMHFVGIFICESHDLSVLHGCTAKLNASDAHSF